MDANEVRAIAAAGETLTTEFKTEAKGALSDRAVAEAAACLANGDGGILLLGIEDDGRITGAKRRHGSTTHAPRVQAVIANLTVPPLSCGVSIVEVDENHVIAIEVDKSTTPIGTSGGVYTRRAMTADGAPQCLPYAFHEMFARSVDVGQVDHARVVLRGMTLADLDPSEIERYRTLCRTAGGDPTLANLDGADLTRALGVVTPDGAVTLGGLLLFGRADAIAESAPTHEVVFQVLHGTTVEANSSTHGPLLAAAEDLYERLSRYNRETELDAGLLRIALPLISPVAIREVVANAFVHRDYTRLGPIQVQLTDDSLTVSSPGGFPEGVNLDNYLNAIRPRSPLLADAFKRAGIVERSGRGINRMMAETIRLGHEAPDFGRSTSTSVIAVFPLGESDIPLARFVIERERNQGQPFALSDLQVLQHLRRDGSLTVGDAAALLQKTVGETRTALGRMVSAGLVDQRGIGRGLRYHLSASVYRAIGDRAAYVRVHGFADIQVEQMVLAYVEAHGRITRHEAADLCSLSSDQASSVLRRLVTTRHLALHGQRRGSYYTLPDT